MRSRYWFTICCLPMAIAVVVVGLMIGITPTREQRAMANLVKAGAHVTLDESPKGIRFFDVDLSSCTNNDELLRCVPEIMNVQSLTLAPAPISEMGVRCLVRLKTLRYLNGMFAHLSNEESRLLKRDLRRDNPNLDITFRETVELNFDK